MSGFSKKPDIDPTFPTKDPTFGHRKRAKRTQASHNPHNTQNSPPLPLFDDRAQPANSTPQNCLLTTEIPNCYGEGGCCDCGRSDTLMQAMAMLIEVPKRRLKRAPGVMTRKRKIYPATPGPRNCLARAETRALVKSAAARRPYCIRRFGRRGDSAPSAARTVRCRLAPQAGGWRRSRE